MQSRRRFFCARVELVQLARAFLCPAPPQPTAAPPGRSPQGTPPGYSIPAAPGQSHAGTLDRVQLRDSRPQYHRHSRTAPPGCNPSTAATEGAQSHATGQGYRGTGKPRNAPQSRPGCNPGGGSFAPGWSLYSLPGLFSVQLHHSPQPPRPGDHHRERRRGIPYPPPRDRATPGRWTGYSSGTAAHNTTGTAGQPRPGAIPPQPPQRAHRATQPGKGTGVQASPETPHRAAHRGQAAGGTETPGRASLQPPQPRHSTPGKNPGDFL